MTERIRGKTIADEVWIDDMEIGAHMRDAAQHGGGAGVSQATFDALETRVGAAETDIDNAESAATALTTRVTTAENDITALQNEGGNKFCLPSAGTGEDGDCYLHTTTRNFYIKISAAWVVQGSLGVSL